MEQLFDREGLAAASLQVIESRAAFLRIMDEHALQGMQGVLVGCTEICLGKSVRQRDTSTPQPRGAEKAVHLALKPQSRCRRISGSDPRPFLSRSNGGR